MRAAFQGPLTLGLRSTSFRSALPAATLPCSAQPFPKKKSASRSRKALSKICFCKLQFFFYFARYSFIAAAALRPSPIGFCRFAPKLKFQLQLKLDTAMGPVFANYSFFLLCQVFIHCRCSFTAFAHC